MKVSELIERLQKCNPDADVEFAYESDATTDGTSIDHVAQIVFFGDELREEKCTVQLQSM